MIKGITLEKGEYGPRAVLTTVWSEEVTEYMLAEGIVELELNDGKGWYGDDLSFLTRLPGLQSFEILRLQMPSVEPIHALHELRSLKVITYCKTEIDFTAFPHLVRCVLQWRPRAKSLFDCATLEDLFVDGYKGKDTEPFARLVNLEHLKILNAPVTNLDGLSDLQKLRTLRLANLRCLTSFSGLASMSHLEELWIDTCKGFHSLTEVGRISRLRRLQFDNCGEIETLEPLNNLERLEWVLFVQSTNILDGDMAPLIRTPSLTNVAFQNRRHYSHRCEEFKGYGSEGRL